MYATVLPAANFPARTAHDLGVPNAQQTLVGGAKPEHAEVRAAQSKKRGRAKGEHGEVGSLTASLRDDGTTAYTLSLVVRSFEVRSSVCAQ
jgi:hypothetical protein